MLRSLLVVSLIPAVSATTAFVMHENPTCDNGLEVDVVSLACENAYWGAQDYCDLGETASVTLTTTVGEIGLTNANISSKICLFGMTSFWEVACYDMGTFDLCESILTEGEVEGGEESGCPASGETTEGSATFDIPGRGGWNLGSSWYATIYTTIKSDEGVYECTTQIDAISVENNTDTAHLIGFAAIVSVVGIFFYRKRRSQVVESEVQMTDFREMSDTGAIA